MLRKIYNALVIVCLVLAVVIGATWIHSITAGFEQTWSAPAEQSCARMTSMQGRFLYQWCDLKTLRKPADPALKWEHRLPLEFAVGTNPVGERTVVMCDKRPIPFLFPADGLFLGATTVVLDDVYPMTSTRCSYQWREYTISYWFALLIVLLAPAAACLGLIIKHFKSVPGTNHTVPASDKPTN
jgi:hypothetical protein